MTRQAQLAAHSQLEPRGSTGAEGFVSKSPRFKSPPSPTALVSAPCCCDARAGIDSSLGIECRRPSWQIREGRRCRHRISEMLDKAQRRRQLRPQRRVVRLALHNRSLRLKHPLHPPPPRRCASPPQRRGEASPAPLRRPPPPRRRPAAGRRTGRRSGGRTGGFARVRYHRRHHRRRASPRLRHRASPLRHPLHCVRFPFTVATKSLAFLCMGL